MGELVSWRAVAEQVWNYFVQESENPAGREVHIKHDPEGSGVGRGLLATISKP